jgi:hypothetical protein
VKIRLLPEPAPRRFEADIVAEYARRLKHDHGFEITDGEECDLTVATGVRGAQTLAERGDRRAAWLVLDLEDRRGVRVPAELWSMPLPVIAGAAWIAEVLATLRGGRAPLLVRPGVAKGAATPTFRPPVAIGTPLRVTVVADEAEGFDQALRAVSGMREERSLTVVQDGVEVGGIAADRIIGPLSPTETSAAMRQSDVVVRTTQAEPLPLVALEAFHGGATCVVAPAIGHDEAVSHGFNGLVTNFDDDRGTSRALDLLARDRRLLAFLRENAIATARAWPSWSQAAGMLALALRRSAGAPC